MEKYQVVFYGDGEDVPYTEQYFDSKSDAEKWAMEMEYDYQDIAIDDNGNDYWKTFYRYYNPEDNENYDGYTVEPVSQNLSEEFYRMQKLAGLITEEEYKARLWYKQYSENISKALDDLKQTLKDEGYDNK
jgi:hypothetical protein